MLDKVCATIAKVNMPAPIKDALLSELRQVPEGCNSIAGQNATLYRCAGVIRQSIAPEQAADYLCQLLYGLTVCVDRQTVKDSIRVNRNKPVELATGDIESLEVEL